MEQNQDSYSDVNDMIQRFRVLEDSNQNLKKELVNLEQNQNALDLEINKFEKNKNDQIILLNNEIAQLQKQLEGIEIRFSKAKDKIDLNENNSSNKQQMLAKLLLSIDNIYDLALKSDVKIRFENQEEIDINDKRKSFVVKGHVKVKKNEYKYNINEYLKKLDYIREKSEALQKIFEMINEKEKTENPSHKKNHFPSEQIWITN